MQDNPQTLQSISQAMPQIGRLEAIIVRPARRMQAVEATHSYAITGVGIKDDRRGIDSTNRIPAKISDRQVTLIQSEHIEVIANIMGNPSLNAVTLRRNLVVSGLNLLAVKSLFKHQIHYLKIGKVLLEITGICTPCSRMETLLGPDGYNAMRGHGGVNAKIIQGGELKVGETVVMLVKTAQQSLAF